LKHFKTELAAMKEANRLISAEEKAGI